MTASSLLEVLTHERCGAEPDRAAALATFAKTLILSSLQNLKQLREYERQAVAIPARDATESLEIRSSLWRLYAEWVEEAERVLNRSRPHLTEGETDPIDVAIGQIQAKLTVRPEQTVRALEDARLGRTVPAKELRDELDARLRA